MVKSPLGPLVMSSAPFSACRLASQAASPVAIFVYMAICSSLVMVDGLISVEGGTVVVGTVVGGTVVGGTVVGGTVVGSTVVGGTTGTVVD